MGEDKKNGKYLNFPISLFTDNFFEVKGTLNKAMYYAVYKHSLGLELGTEEEKIKSAAKFFNIRLDNINNVAPSYDDICATYYIKAPNVSLHLPIMWDYHENEKSEFQIACFRAFCAIKSILGKKDIVLTNKEMIVARMFGESKPDKKQKDIFGNTLNKEPEFTTSISDACSYLRDYGYDWPAENVITDAIKKGDLDAVKSSGWKIKKTDLIKWANKSKLKKKDIDISKVTNETLKLKYSKRYQIDKVLSELQLSWGLNLHAVQGMRGFRLSFKKDIEDIAIINEKSKRKTKEEALKERKRLATEKAKEIVKNEIKPYYNDSINN